MNTAEQMDFYKMVKENRIALYSKPRRYYNRDGIKGSAIKFLFFVQAIIFFLMLITVKNAMGQLDGSKPMMTANVAQNGSNIYNYTTTYNSGKVFLNWTAKNETADCIYIIERSGDGKKYDAVGLKEGIGTNVELFYSWLDNEPPTGYSFYRVKKIAKDGAQYYSSVNSIINQSSSFDPKQNYASGQSTDKNKKQ
ncbi:MAG: hypothetical protein IPJ79_14645 [Bacteroidetes bacterium]|nr:hypothetical protein [Bacteroidota bacterium]